MATSYATLKDVRERMLGYRADFVSRATGIAQDRLTELETEPTSSISVSEAESLARLYGLAAEAFAERPIQTSGDQAIQVHQYADEGSVVPDPTRAAIVAAACAARDVQQLRKLLQTPPLPMPPDLRTEGKHGEPFQQGRDKAQALRKKLALPNGPISSVRDLVRDSLSKITLLYARLGQDGPAGLTFVDTIRGPTIVLNFEGKNENPLVRRFSLAHELCHVLNDWQGAQPLAVLSGYFDERELDRERRANAFAVRLLCPESELARVRNVESGEAVARISNGFGLPYRAARLYLRNLHGTDLAATPPPGASLASDPKWAQAERPIGVEGFPLSSVPIERCTIVAELASRAYSSGLIRRGTFAEYLGVSVVEDLDRVLDFFALDRPANH